MLRLTEPIWFTEEFSKLLPTSDKGGVPAAEQGNIQSRDSTASRCHCPRREHAHQDEKAAIEASMLKTFEIACSN